MDYEIGRGIKMTQTTLDKKQVIAQLVLEDGEPSVTENLERAIKRMNPISQDSQLINRSGEVALTPQLTLRHKSFGGYRKLEFVHNGDGAVAFDQYFEFLGYLQNGH